MILQFSPIFSMVIDAVTRMSTYPEMLEKTIFIYDKIKLEKHETTILSQRKKN